jgi:nicotinate-nucleotide adenylyltransferase
LKSRNGIWPLFPTQSGWKPLLLTLKKIGIYGGTFDPLHHGHLILARDACETLELEKMIFVPTAASPHKMDRTATAAEIRLEMVRKGTEGEAQFEVDDCELQRNAPSYTIDTVKIIQRRESSARIFYCLGEDNLAGLTSWHRFDELQRLVQFVVLDRRGFENKTNYPVIRRHIDISATEIRKRVAEGRSIRYLVPHAVEEIIRREELYREPKESKRKI